MNKIRVVIAVAPRLVPTSCPSLLGNVGVDVDAEANGENKALDSLCEKGHISFS
jgi:hypothetical protein